MFRSLSTPLVAAILAALTYHAHAHPQDSRPPLDLPSGGWGVETAEESVPEAIAFYGTIFEGNAFVWCLDKSGSMVTEGRLDILKEEVMDAIRSLSPRAEVGLVAFSTNVIRWHPAPLPATRLNQDRASRWIGSLVPSGNTCVAAGAIAALQIGQQSSVEGRQLIVVSDGRPNCQGSASEEVSLEQITGANHEQLPIHTLLLGRGDDGVPFMQSLASANRGSFRHVTGD